MEKIKIEELGIEVEDVGEFNDEAGEVLTAFCNDLEAKGMTQPVEEDRKWWAEEEGISFFWNSEASKLIEAELNRLYGIGTRYFGRTLDLDISSHMFKQP